MSKKLESYIIKYAMENNTFNEKMLLYVDDINCLNYTPTKTILKEIIAYNAQYHRLPSYDDIEIRLPSSDTKELLNKIKTSNVALNYDNMVYNTELYLKNNKVYNSFSDNIEKFSHINTKDEQESVFSELALSIADANSFSFHQEIRTSDIDDAEDMEEYLDDSNSGYHITTGFDKMDWLLNGGWLKKTLSNYMAATHVGKTMMLLNNAVGAYLSGHNVYYITLEISKEETKKRLWSCMLDYDINQISINTIDIIKEKLSDLKGKFSPRFIRKERQQGRRVDYENEASLKIDEYATYSLTIEQIDNNLKKYEEVHGCKPDIIFIDYLALLKKPKHLLSKNSYEEGRYFTNEIRRLAVEHEVAIVSAVSSTREAGKKRGTDSLEDAADSYEYAKASDVVFAIKNTDEQGEQISCVPIKNRVSGRLYKKLFLEKKVERQSFIEQDFEEEQEADDFDA